MTNIISHRVCGIIREERVEIDFSTLPVFVHEGNESIGVRSFIYNIVHLFRPSPPRGYMLRLIAEGSLHQGVFNKRAFFFPTEEAVCLGLKWFPTRQCALDYAKVKLCNKNTKCSLEDFDAVEFNHKLEMHMYDAAKWEWIKEV